MLAYGRVVGVFALTSAEAERTLSRTGRECLILEQAF